MRVSEQKLQIIGALLEALRDKVNVPITAMTSLDENASNFEHYLVSQNAVSIQNFATPRGPKTCVEMLIDKADVLNIPDNSKLPDGTGCPMMAAEGLFGYLGAPLFSSYGCIGAVEIMSLTPRIWTKLEIEFLRSIAEQINVLILTESDIDPKESATA